MDWEKKPPIIHFTPPTPTSTSTISELISHLRSHFRKENFDLVESILLSREENLKKSVRDLSAKVSARKSDCELLEGKHSQLKLDKMMVEDELKKCRRECYEVRGDLSKCVIDRDELRERVMRLSEEQEVCSIRYDNLVDNSRKIEKSLRNVVKEYEDRIEVLRAEKCKAERDVLAEKKKHDDLMFRVKRLEDNVAVLEIMEDEDGQLLKGVSGQKGKLEKKFGFESVNEKVAELQSNRGAADLVKKGLSSPHAGTTWHSPRNLDNLMEEGAAADSFGKDCDDGRATIHRVVPNSRYLSQMMASPTSGSSKSAFPGIIEINSDDDDDEKPTGNGKAIATNSCASEPVAGEKEASMKLGSIQTGEEDKGRCRQNLIPYSMPKRKRTSSSERCEAISEKRKTRALKELLQRPNGPSDHSLPVHNLGSTDGHLSRCDNPSPFSSGSRDERLNDSYVDDLVANPQRKRECEVWKSVGDMAQEFERDPELCMNAVCTLYRQQKLRSKSGCRSLPASSNHGFEQFDILRGTKLAELLIEGDPEYKLRKSASQLEKDNPQALEECRKFARLYSNQLFQIYKGKQDPFFFLS